jgi:serine/threonine-protein kinase
MSRHLYANRYQASAVIGSGRTSEVHRGQDRLVGRDVVIKVLRADLSQDPSFQVRFRREAKNAAALNHPAILAVYDSGERETAAGPVPYIVMEYVDGRTLQEVLADDGTVPPQRALQIAAEICAALDFSHRHGMVHRDIKPANVMLGRNGSVKVMDFGIARAVADGPGSTTATTVIGSAQYLSPEQARGETGDTRSDLYATGCVLYEMLTGTPPFTGRSPIAVASRHIREAPRPPSEINRALPKELDAIVLKALNKNPANRYQTAKEMRTDLARALAGRSVQATPVMTAAERAALIEEAPPAAVGAATAGEAVAREGGGIPHGPVLLAPVVTLSPPTPGDGIDPDAAARNRRRWRMVALGAVGVAVVVALWLTLMVILAPPPPAAVAVPDLTGMTLEQAVGKLSDKQLTLGTVTKVDTPDGEAGTVVNQRPSWQTQVDQNTPVNVEIEQP